MARVQVAMQTWGYVQGRDGKPRAGIAATFSGTVYESATGDTEVTSFVSDGDGHYPGWVDPGTYTITDADGETFTIEAISGGDLSIYDDRVDALEGLAKSPKTYGCIGDGTTNDATNFQTAVDDLATGEVLDLGGDTYYVTTPIEVATDNVTLRNGKLLGAVNQVLDLNAADVTALNMRFERTADNTSASNGGDLALRSCVRVRGARFRSINSDYTNASLACLFFANGLANGSRVTGGHFKNSGASQDSSLVFAQSGASVNKDIVIDGATLESTGCAQCVSLFDPYACRVINNRIFGATELPRTNLTGWTLVSGDVYKTASRTDGSLGGLFNNSVQLTWNTATPTTPGASEWGETGGEVYVNLSGTDPNSRTMESRILSGYGLSFYSSEAGRAAGAYTSYNVAANNYIHDVDGFGIYWQIGGTALVGVQNSTSHNVLKDVCTSGSQVNNLNFAAISIVGGVGTVLDSDQIDDSGFEGVWHSDDARGTMKGVIVRGATRAGFRASSGHWSYIGCKSLDHDGAAGFWASATAGVSWTSLRYIDCEAVGGTAGRGMFLDNTSGTALQATVSGGVYRANTLEGIRWINCTDSYIGGGVVLRDNSSWGMQISGASSARITVDGLHMPSGNTTGAFTVAAGITAGEVAISNLYPNAGVMTLSSVCKWNGPPLPTARESNSVVAAATLTLPHSHNVVTVTGNTNITSITASWAGRQVTLIFTGTPTLTDGSNLKLGANFVATADDAIALACDGTNWHAPGPGSAN